MKTFLSSAGSLVGHPAGYPGSVLGHGLHHLPLQPLSRHRWHLAFSPVWQWKLNIVNIRQLCSTGVCEGGDRRGHTCPTLSGAQCHSAAPVSLPRVHWTTTQLLYGTAISMFAPCKKGPAVAFDLILLPRLSHLNSTVDIVKINGLRLFIAVALNIIITWVRLVELPRASTFERSITSKVAEMFISYSAAIMKHLHQQLNNINGQLHYTVFNLGRWFYCVNRVKRSPWQSTMVGDFFSEWTELYISDTQITRKEILGLLL